MADKFEPTIIIYYILICRGVSVGVERRVISHGCSKQILIDVSFRKNAIGSSRVSQLKKEVKVVIGAGILCLIVKLVTRVLLVGS